ncbi:MAG: pyridoxamine 5'-phosphate oxidase family protein [Anaerolineae bacterium]
MSPRVTDYLPDPLFALLKEGCPALLLTVGEDGYPATAYTWAAALQPTTVRFGADHGSATLANLERAERASLQVIQRENLIFLIKGNTSPVKTQIEAAPFKIAMLALEVTEVKDQSWPGVSMQPLAYEWAAGQRDEMLAMEQAVYAEMREWQP